MSERKKKGFNYVDIVTSGCEGWINLFFDEHIIALVNNVYLATKIKASIDANSIELHIPPDQLRPGEPCDHPGCLQHRTHPCEGCGRIAGR